jgi:fatty acid synthase subunit alpha
MSLFSLLIEPPNRFANSKEAQEWLDKAVQMYSNYHSIQISKTSSQHSSQGSIIVPVSNEQLTALQIKQDILVRNQLDVLAEYLDLDLRSGSRLAEAHMNEIEKLQKEIMRWKSEHGQDYVEGVQPHFTPLKIRIYDCFENWAQQDLFVLYNDMISGKQFDFCSPEMKFIAQQTLNRMTPKTLDFLKELLYQLQTAANSSANNAKFFADLIEQSKNSSNSSFPVYRECMPNNLQF